MGPQLSIVKDDGQYVVINIDAIAALDAIDNERTRICLHNEHTFTVDEPLAEIWVRIYGPQVNALGYGSIEDTLKQLGLSRFGRLGKLVDKY